MLRRSPNHGTQRLPNDDDDDDPFIPIYLNTALPHHHIYHSTNPATNNVSEAHPPPRILHRASSTAHPNQCMHGYPALCAHGIAAISPAVNTSECASLGRACYCAVCSCRWWSCLISAAHRWRTCPEDVMTPCPCLRGCRIDWPQTGRAPKFVVIKCVPNAMRACR